MAVVVVVVVGGSEGRYLGSSQGSPSVVPAVVVFTVVPVKPLCARTIRRHLNLLTEVFR